MVSLSISTMRKFKRILYHIKRKIPGINQFGLLITILGNKIILDDEFQVALQNMLSTM